MKFKKKKRKKKNTLKIVRDSIARKFNPDIVKY